MDPNPDPDIRPLPCIKQDKIKRAVRHSKIIMSIAILAGMVMLFSCKNDLKTIESLTGTDSGPIETTWSIEMVYSEAARKRVRVTAPRMDVFEGEKNYIELPEGIEVLFYDSLGRQTSSISAKYAISFDNNQRIEAENDVVVINEAGETLNTEHLVWDREAKTIFSDKFVKITSGEEVLYGDGLEADERFEKWVIKSPRGSFVVNTDDSL